MIKARLFGVLATVALLAGTAACDSPTGAGGREAGPGTLYNTIPVEAEPATAYSIAQAQADAAQADSLVTEYTIAEGTTYALHAGPAPAPADETYLIPLSGGRVLDLIVPVGSSVHIYPDPSNPNIKHIVVKFPDGSIHHYIWNPTTGLKLYKKPAQRTTTRPTSGSTLS